MGHQILWDWCSDNMSAFQAEVTGLSPVSHSISEDSRVAKGADCVRYSIGVVLWKLKLISKKVMQVYR